MLLARFEPCHDTALQLAGGWLSLRDTPPPAAITKQKSLALCDLASYGESVETFRETLVQRRFVNVLVSGFREQEETVDDRQGKTQISDCGN